MAIAMTKPCRIVIFGFSVLVSSFSFPFPVSAFSFQLPDLNTVYTEIFAVEFFTEQQLNRFFAIIFSRITGPKFSRFLQVSVATWLQNI